VGVWWFVAHCYRSINVSVLVRKVVFAVAKPDEALCPSDVARTLGVPADVVAELMRLHDVPGPLPADFADDIATGLLPPPAWLAPAYHHVPAGGAAELLLTGNHILAGLLQSSIGRRSHPDHGRTGRYAIAAPIGVGDDMHVISFTATHLTTTDDASLPAGRTFTITHHDPDGEPVGEDVFVLDVPGLWLAMHLATSSLLADTLLIAVTTETTADHESPTAYTYGYVVEEPNTLNPDAANIIVALAANELMDLFNFDADLFPPTDGHGRISFLDAPELLEMQLLR